MKRMVGVFRENVVKTASWPKGKSGPDARQTPTRTNLRELVRGGL